MSTTAKRLWPRGLSAVVLSVIAFICHIVSVTTPLIVQKVNVKLPVAPGVVVDAHQEIRVAVIKTKVKVNVPGAPEQETTYDSNDLPGSCDKIHKLSNTIAAFFFMSLIMCVFACVAAVLNMLGIVPSLVASVLLAVTAVFSFIGVLIGFLLWENSYCDGVDAWTDRDGAKIFTASPFLLVALVLEIVAIILTCVLPKGPHDLPKSKSDPALTPLPPADPYPQPIEPPRYQQSYQTTRNEPEVIDGMEVMDL